MEFEYQRWARTRDGYFTYEFKLIEEKLPNQTLVMEPFVTKFSDAACELELLGEPQFQTDNKTFTQDVHMLKRDGSELITEDRCLFDLSFSLLNADGSKSWDDKMYYISIVYRV